MTLYVYYCFPYFGNCGLNKNTNVFMQVSLASDLMYKHMSRDVTASVGYDYVFRQVDSAIRNVLGSSKILL